MGQLSAGTPEWASLSHAYGPALDTPQHLSRLRSEHATVRQQAWYDLIGSAYHQGDLYPVTPWIVMPLMDLAIEPRYPDRADAMAYVTLIVEDLHYHLDQRDGLRQQDSSSDNPRRSHRDQLLTECRRMATDRANDVQSLTQDVDPEIRRWALRVFGVLARVEAAEGSHLRDSLTDPDPLTRAVGMWQLKITSRDQHHVSRSAAQLADNAERNALDYFMAHVVLLSDRHMPKTSAREILRLQDLVGPDFEKAGLHHVAESPMVFAVVLSEVGSEVEVEALAG